MLKGFAILITMIAVLVGCGTSAGNLRKAEAAYAENPTPALQKEVDIWQDKVWEHEQRVAYNLENWLLCEKIYYQEGWFTVHMGHRHPSIKRFRMRPLSPHIVLSDLRSNHCYQVVPRAMWAQ